MRVKELSEDASAFRMWSGWQKALSEMTGLAVGMVDYRGMPITGCEGSCEFCHKMRDDHELGKYCQKCDALGSLEAVMTEAPYVYRCHFSLVNVAVPIIKNGCYMGSVVAGHVRLDNEKETDQLKQVLILEEEKIERKKRSLQKDFDRIPVLGRDELDRAITMIYNGSKSLIRRDSELHDGLEPMMTNQIIARALEYIDTMGPGRVTLPEVAEHCHVSVSYLSRLFTRETGENYSEYVAKQKIKWAREKLESTDMTITEISEELGYGESGYFIKTFKRYVQETPCAYRRRYKRNRLSGSYLTRRETNGERMEL